MTIGTGIAICGIWFAVAAIAFSPAAPGIMIVVVCAAFATWMIADEG